MQSVTITPKFQVHIPVAIRKKIGLKKHGRATIEAKNGAIIIRPAKGSILDLGGSLHEAWKKNPIPIEKLRDYIDYSS